MNGFKQQLEQVIHKGRVEKSQNADQPPSSRRPKSIFSMTAFANGLMVCSLFFAGMIGWAWFQSAATNQMIRNKLASKTAIVERGTAEIYQMDNRQTVLTMPADTVQPVEATTPEVAMAEPVPTEAVPAATAETAKTAEIPQPPETPTPHADTTNVLVQAPVPGLYESVTAGMLPTPRAEDNLTPFEAYKRPFQKISNKPLLSIVIADAGLSRKTTEEIVQNLPPEIALSFSPYARDLKLLTTIARQKGHEVWLTLPMETKNYPLADPGPSSLLVNASVEQNKSRLTSVLASTQGYAGFISQKNHVFKQEDANVNPAIQEIFDRGLAIIDSNPALYSFVGSLAATKDYPNAKNNFWLDDDLTPTGLNQKIRQMIELGGTGQDIVVMLHPYPASIKALQKFLSSSAAENFQLAPVSAQINYGE